MGMEKGLASFRVLSFLGDNCLNVNGICEKFQDKAGCQIENLFLDDENVGWTTGRHLLETEFEEFPMRHGSYFHMQLRRAVRKIPASLLAAECKREELLRMQVEDRPFLSRREKADIRESLMNSFSDKATVSLRGNEIVMTQKSQYMLSGTMSAKDCDAMIYALGMTLGMTPYVLTPDALAAKHGKPCIEWPPISFSPNSHVKCRGECPGREFMTWLLYESEQYGGHIDVMLDGRKCDVSVLVEGPLVFASSGDSDGAQEASLRKGFPVTSAEAKGCLMVGKLLRRARVSVSIQDWVWTCNLDADEFVVRSLMTPKIEEFLDGESTFDERMARIYRFVDILFALFERFLDVRTDAGYDWGSVHSWLEGRVARA